LDFDNRDDLAFRQVHVDSDGAISIASREFQWIQRSRSPKCMATVVEITTPPVHPKRCYFLLVVEGRYAAIPITRPTQTRASNRANPTLSATYFVLAEIRVPLMTWPTGRGRDLDICVYFTRNCLLPCFSLSFCSPPHHLEATNRNNHVCKQLRRKSSPRRPSFTNNHRKTQKRNRLITTGSLGSADGSLRSTTKSIKRASHVLSAKPTAT
jgi:hypothetical protein